MIDIDGYCVTDLQSDPFQSLKPGFELFSHVQLRTEIDSLMAKYVGQEHTMYLKICKKYSVTPEPEIKATAGGMDMGQSTQFSVMTF